jgi:hypothetical protein
MQYLADGEGMQAKGHGAALGILQALVAVQRLPM